MRTKYISWRYDGGECGSAAALSNVTVAKTTRICKLLHKLLLLLYGLRAVSFYDIVFCVCEHTDVRNSRVFNWKTIRLNVTLSLSYYYNNISPQLRVGIHFIIYTRSHCI